MKKLLLIALAALSFGTASADKQADGTWKWCGMEAPAEAKGTSMKCYIRNVQTGEFLKSASFTTVVDNSTSCSADLFTIEWKENWTNDGLAIKNKGGKYITWGGVGVNTSLGVNENNVRNLIVYFAYIHFRDGSAENGYKIYYGGLTDSWYLFLGDDLKTLKKSGSENEESPYIYWQLISKEEMDKYHEYVHDNDVLNLYKGTFGSDIKNGHQYTNIYVHRQLKAGYNTIALPFNVANVEAAFGAGAYVSKFTGATVENGVYTLTFTKQSYIVANEPYILHLNAATPEVLTFPNTTAVSEESVSTANYEGWTFHSNFLPNQPMKDKYGVVNSTAKIMRGSGSATINGLTAYFTFNGTALNSVQAIFVDGQGELTDIQQLEPVGTENGQTIYNLAGQRVSNATNGINIINGRKVLKK